MTFLVTTPIPTPGMEILAAAGPVDVLPAPPTAEQLAELCASGNYDILVAQLRDDLGVETLRSAVLRGVSVYAVGVNNVDLAAATRRGIVVANTPDVLTDATADVAMLLMLAAARRASRRTGFCARAAITAGSPSSCSVGTSAVPRSVWPGLAGSGPLRCGRLLA